MGHGVSKLGNPFCFACRLLSRCVASDLETDVPSETGKLYGAQCVGYEGVDKRIDQIAGLIKHGGTVYDLMETEHTYAPPFSSAKDPIAIAGYVASNIISGAMPGISWRELAEKKDEVMLIDTRTPEEFSFGTIPGAVNIPLDEMRDRLSEIPADKPVVLFCAVGLRGYLATTYSDRARLSQYGQLDRRI